MTPRLTCECGGTVTIEWRPGGTFHQRAVCECGRSTRWANCGHDASAERFWRDGVWEDAA